jgi:hypothetical protein
MIRKKYFKENLIGKRFGKLIIIDVIEESNSIAKDGIFICDCDCGTRSVKVLAGDILYEHTKSCGCDRKNKAYQTGKNNKKYNKYNLIDEYGIGYTKKDEEFYFDLEDYDKIKDYCWHINSNGYVATRNNNKIIKMHTLLISYNYIDHKNRIRHDNRKDNIRYATSNENAQNHTVRKDNTSGITGVQWNKNNNNWRVVLNKNKIRINIGSFENENDAIKLGF